MTARLNAFTKEYEMKINVKKTCMFVSRKGNSKIHIFGQDVKHVSEFKHFGSWITYDGIQKHIQGRVAMEKKQNIAAYEWNQDLSFLKTIRCRKHDLTEHSDVKFFRDIT